MKDSADQEAALSAAIEQLLLACTVDMEHPDLQKTPQRVAQLWLSEFLWGYRQNPAHILADLVEGEEATEIVIVRAIPYHGLCPHHLLPYFGMADVAYQPHFEQPKLVGFGRLSELVNCFTRRLALQEHACNQIVASLMTFLGARGAGCVLRGHHTCLKIPENKHAASVLTSSFRGEMVSRSDLQAILYSDSASR